MMLQYIDSSLESHLTVVPKTPKIPDPKIPPPPPDLDPPFDMIQCGYILYYEIKTSYFFLVTMYNMLSFESSTAPQNKAFFLGALAGAAKVARVGAVKTVSRVRVPAGGRPLMSSISRVAKPLGGITINPSFQKTNNTSTTTTYDYSTNSTVNNNN